MRDARSVQRQRRHAARGTCRSSGPSGCAAPICCSSAAARAMAAGARVDVRAALEARRRLGLEAEALAGPPHRRRLEVRALEDHQLRAGADLGRRAAHDAADRLRPLGVGDHQHVGLERAVDAVQRPELLARLRAPDPQRPARELRVVERVRRLAHLEHHVVGDVDDRADAADAGRPRAVPASRPAEPPVDRTSNTCAQ